jgi:ammonia channel protein AmtB
VSLSIAGIVERSKMLVPLAFSLVISLGVLPIISAWTFGGGYLHQLGYQDYGNCGAFHLCGGIASILGSAIIGPRIGRFRPLAVKKSRSGTDMKLSDEKEQIQLEIDEIAQDISRNKNRKPEKQEEEGLESERTVLKEDGSS